MNRATTSSETQNRGSLPRRVSRLKMWWRLTLYVWYWLPLLLAYWLLQIIARLGEKAGNAADWIDKRPAIWRKPANKRLAELQIPEVGNNKGDTYLGGFSRKKKTVACSIRQNPSKYGPHMTDDPLTTVRDIGWDGNLIFFIGPDMVSKRERSYGATKEALTEFIAYRANEIKNVSDYLASGMNNRSDEWPDWQ